jgi:hypothetical protein
MRCCWGWLSRCCARSASGNAHERTAEGDCHREYPHATRGFANQCAPSKLPAMLKPRSPRDSLLDEAYWRLRYLLSCGCCQNVATGRFGPSTAAKEKARTPVTYWHPSSCDPNRIRTGVTAVRGQRTRPLYDGAVTTTLRVCHMARRPAKQRPPRYLLSPDFTIDSGSVTDSSPLRAASTPKTNAITPPRIMTPAPR